MLLAQVSDTHVKANERLAYGKVDTSTALRACVRHLNDLDPRPDAVVITGDLVDAGRPDEYAALKRMLDALAMPFYLIPGNHDERAALRAAFPEHDYLRSGGEFIHYAIERYPVRLVGLDSTIPGASSGTMCERRLAWLDATLDREPDRPTLLFMHHPPFLTGIAHMDAQNCANADALGAVVRRHPQVTRLVCGHVHRAIQVHWQGITASIGPSPSHAVALDLRGGPPALVIEPPACQLHRWQPGEGLVSHLSFIGDYGGRHPFFDGDGRLLD